MAHKARRRPSWHVDRRYARRARCNADFVARLMEACRAPTVRMPDTMDLDTWFSLSWEEAVARDPTYDARNAAPLREGTVVISKVPMRIKGERVPPGSVGVIIAREGDRETYVVAFRKTAEAVTLERNEIEPKLP